MACHNSMRIFAWLLGGVGRVSALGHYAPWPVVITSVGVTASEIPLLAIARPVP
jgi:hypothetical protein